MHHSIDATRLSTYKTLRREAADSGGFDTIAFMFPHTGGLSTDVNRQVRANQSLLVSFFQSCLELDKDGNPRHNRNKKREDQVPFLKLGGRVVVTLFEAEPYTLWNIRDLARHAGLKVVESFRFEWVDYPGYSHVRTLGAIEGGGGWKGEERKARMYVFEKVEVEREDEEEGSHGADSKERSKKRRRQESESESDDN